AVVVLLRSRATAHPGAWRLYAASLLVGCAGSGAVVLVEGSSRAAVLASLPGQALGAVALLGMVDSGVRRAQRATTVPALALYVVAVQLGLHAGLELVALVPGLPPALDPTSSLLLASGAALVTGSALLVFATQRPSGGGRGAALLTAQASWSLVALTAQLTPRDLGSPLQAVTVVAGAVATAAVLRALRLDTGEPPGPSSASSPGRAATTALLPHVAALLGGTLLLVTVAVTGRIGTGSFALGVVGLGLLLVHQFAAWRAHTQLQETLRRSEARFRTLVRGNVDPVVVLDEGLRISWVSPTIDELLGLDADGLVGRPLTLLVHPDDAAWLLDALRAPAVDGPGEDTTVTARLRHRDGRWRLVRARVRDLRADPDVGALVLYARDVTDTVPAATSREALRATETVDAASGLPNGTVLAQRLAVPARSGNGPTATQGALLLLAVPGLLDEPPAALSAVLTAVSRVLRGGDWLARTAVDQFAVLVEGGVAEAEVVGARLVGALDRLPPSADRPTPRCAVGVTTLVPELSGGDLLRRAEVALRSALDAGTGPGRVARWSTAERERNDRRDLLRADLGRALTQGQLRLVYQPVVDVALHRTATVEALLRWDHPVLGEVSPAEFVPLAEESALITELGRFVLQRATRDVAGLADARVAVAVNISTRHLVGGSLVADVSGALAGSGLAPSRLLVEITESVLVEDQHVDADLQALRACGVRVALDDFGTGWSSLAYLAGLPVDVLKMDKQFLQGIESDPHRRELCRVVLDLGTSLGLPVIVEGVETEAELHLVRAMGHRYVQGYVLSRPVELGELDQRLDTLDTATREVPA
ncbi:bifunctional diguanylate cyclase/phosphodiesterase, partial [Klenkia sp. PcliD-1-E]|uniref:putative bifunctional diguanylate cyclase/phosphodiesterase n=1 Tax=Klenkia sp. PcliD-1-E TaxID=2954492 RepID=UPI00209701F4